jgi:hypothetical protein
MSQEPSETLILLIGSIDGKMDTLIDSVKDHSDRINKLEHDKLTLSGMIMGVSAAVTWLLRDRLTQIVSLFHQS